MEYAPTQFREMVSQVTLVIQMPAATSIVTLAKSNPEMPADGQPGIGDLDYDVELVH